MAKTTAKTTPTLKDWHKEWKAEQRAKRRTEAKREAVFQTITQRGGSRMDYGSGRAGYWLPLHCPNGKYVGQIQLVERAEDGEYSLSVELAKHVETELVKVGVVIHKRAKPTRKVLTVRQMLAG